jgi:hypothetical protein
MAKLRPPPALSSPGVLVSEQQAEVAPQSAIDGIKDGKLDRIRVEFVFRNRPKHRVGGI